MEEEKQIKKEVAAIVLLLIIVVSLLGTYMFYQMTDYGKKHSKSTSAQAPAVSLTILPSKNEEGVEPRDQG